MDTIAPVTTVTFSVGLPITAEQLNWILGVLAIVGPMILARINGRLKAALQAVAEGVEVSTPRQSPVRKRIKTAAMKRGVNHVLDKAIGEAKKNLPVDLPKASDTKTDDTQAQPGADS